MTQKEIEALLERRIGLSPDSLGGDTIQKAVNRRMKGCGIGEPAAYLAYLDASDAEWEELLELVVVPETWFFRNKESFAFLTRYVRTEWLNRPGGLELRVLSIPCASGEEPYSVAMALADTGLPPDRLQIEGMDISALALEKARRGVYGPEAFRGKNLSFRERYFEPVSGGHRIDPTVKARVTFQRANLMEEGRFAGLKPYDVIFCRNLLIYLSDRGKARALNVIDRLLKPGGLLFVGHVERSLIRNPGFQWIKQPGVFACQRVGGPSIPDGPAGSKPVHRSIRPHIQRPPAAPPASVPEAGIRREPVPVQSRPETRRRPAAPQPPPSTAVEGYLAQAQRMADQGKMEDAFRLCEKSVSENAFHIQAHFLMGLICHAMDDEERAEEAFNKAVYLDPNHHEAMSHLAFIMEHRGERNRAERLRQRAQRIREKEERT